MKYIITESKLNEVITNYFNELFDVENISLEHPYDYDEDSGEDYEDTNRIAFYSQDMGGIHTDDWDSINHFFKWYSCDYFNPGSYAQDICPTVVIESYYEKRLNGFFGDAWIEPFKAWFKDHFDLPVKTVEW